METWSLQFFSSFSKLQTKRDESRSSTAEEISLKVKEIIDDVKRRGAEAVQENGFKFGDLVPVVSTGVSTGVSTVSRLSIDTPERSTPDPLGTPDPSNNGVPRVVIHKTSSGLKFREVKPKVRPHGFHPRLFLDRAALSASFDSLPTDIKQVLINAHERIKRFAEAQRKCLSPLQLDVHNGSQIGHEILPVESAGCYAPGGRYPLPSSVLMTVATAKVAGVERVVLSSPKPTTVTQAAAYLAGADGLLAVGGAAAIAAMGYGMEPFFAPCDVVVGPGNAYVTEAKFQVSRDVRIDLLAGPSELFVLADDSADALLVAHDLLAQAEHDSAACVCLITDSKQLASNVAQHVLEQTLKLPEPNQSVVKESISLNSGIVVVESLEIEGVAAVNAGAPEHLEIISRRGSELRANIKNAGAIFEGSGAAEVLGDYGVGPNHTLPTSRASRFRGGLSVFDFLRVRTFMRTESFSKSYEDLLNDCVALARCEGLEGHARSAEQRKRLSTGDSAGVFVFEGRESNDAQVMPSNGTTGGMKGGERSRVEAEVLESQNVSSSFISPFIREDVGALMEYHPVKPLSSIAAEIGMTVGSLAKLNANENLYGARPGVVAEIQRELQSSLCYYPDPDQTELITQLSMYTNLPKDKIVCGAGGDDIIQLLIQICRPDGIVVGTPAFPMYDFFARINRTVVHTCEIFGTPAPPDLTKLHIMAKETGSSLIFLASPNNPTGHLVNWDDLLRLCRSLPSSLIVLDQAYIEFAEDSRDLTSIFAQVSNLAIVRTFSKWAGLAGIRCGYCLADESVVRVLKQVKIPYNLNSAASLIASRVLQRSDDALKIVGKCVKERRHLHCLFSFSPFSEAFTPWRSASNFILFDIKKSNASELHTKLWSCGVLTRFYTNQSLKNCIRISVGRESQTRQLINSLQTTKFIPDGILWDMDGVLADVTNSYRSAIVATCLHFNVEVTLEDVAELKRRGGFNNDWQLTRKLIEMKSDKAIGLDVIVPVFQSLYNSKYCQNETLIVPHSDLHYLSQTLAIPMGIVTGRPRDEAVRFMRYQQIEKFFQCVVCMEDTMKHKPDADPLVKGFEALQLQLPTPKLPTLVYFGDTKDDMQAAIAATAALESIAEILPVGCVAPGDHGEGAEDAAKHLWDNGAKAVGLRWDVVGTLGLPLPVDNAATSERSTTVEETSSVATSQVSVGRELKVNGSREPDSWDRPRSSGVVSRQTKETSISCKFCLDGSGVVSSSTGIGFLDHMIDQLGRHGSFDISIKCQGDLHIDDHHTVEDCALVLGQSINAALGERVGIERFGFAVCPLDEALARVVVDLSGRGFADIQMSIARDKVGDLSVEMVPHFFQSLATTMRAAVHVDVLKGTNAHHQVEASFKAFAVAMRNAVRRSNSKGLPSTKGLL